MSNSLDISIKTEGMEYVRNVLQQLGHFQEATAVKKAWITGGRYLIQKGKASYRKENRQVTGNLYKSFKYTVKRGNTGLHVGFRRSSGQAGEGGGNHAHLVDLGHNVYSHGVKTGKRTKGSLFWTKVRESDVSPAGRMIGNQMLAAYGEYLQTQANGCPNYSNKYY